MYKRAFAWFCPKTGATECPFECGGRSNGYLGNAQMNCYIFMMVLPLAWSPYHRYCLFTKLPWALSKQASDNRDDKSWRGNGHLIAIHCIWHWDLSRLSLRPPNNHWRRRLNLDGEKLWQELYRRYCWRQTYGIQPATCHKKQQQRRQSFVPYWWNELW